MDLMYNKSLAFIAQVSPLILAACSALISEYAGMLNIGIEGLILIGAFLGIISIYLTGSAWGAILGIVLAILIGGLIVRLIAYLSIKKDGNIFILGLAINLLAGGIVSILSSALTNGESIISIPYENLIPTNTLKLIVSITVLSISIFLILFIPYTKAGLRLKVLGRDTNLLNNLGVPSDKLKMNAMFFSGALATLAGAFLSLQLGAFVPNQSAGKGWIALVLAYAGGRSFLGVFIASVIFVAVENFVGAAQLGLEHPSITIGIPFIISLLIIIVQSIIKAGARHLKINNS